MAYGGGGDPAGYLTEVLPPSSAAVAVSHISPFHDERMWQLSLRGSQGMEPGLFPERPGQPDCSYYIRTGLCRFGMTCKYNHPPNRNLAIAAARMKGEYPERVGQPECQYYLKTGTCKYGATCKYHHPKDKVTNTGRVQLNSLGFPLRPNEKECSYYLRTGECKFGSTCKYHHPQPSTAVSGYGSIYPSVHSPISGQQSYTGGVANWPMSRASFITSPRWQSPSYTHLVLPQGLMQWNAYTGQMGSISSPDGQHQTSGQAYGISRQSQSNTSPQGPSHRSGLLPMGLYALQRESMFPERPDQPECQFYMKTGDCKFGAVCKFHHPKERRVPVPNCALSSLGLPVRPGETLCHFYSRYGICKFGPNCKFDHPMGTTTGVSTYDLSVSPSSDLSGARQLFGSSSPPRSSSGRNSDFVQGKPRRLSMPESRQVSSGDENTETDG